MAAAAINALQKASSNTGSAFVAAGVAATQLEATVTDGVPVGLQQLRVLDLSVAGGSSGGLSGSLPGAFDAMQGLQVGSRALAELPLI
jgi:hypothetical protein